MRAIIKVCNFTNPVFMRVSEVDFANEITILWKKKGKKLKDFKKDDYFCNHLCGVRSYCNRSRSYKKNRE